MTIFAMMGYIGSNADDFIEVQLGVLVFQEDDSYLAYCPALNLSTYGESINDAKGAFDDLIAAYLADAIKMGTLEKDLIAHGWTLQGGAGKAQLPQQIELSIPAGVLRRQFNHPFRIPSH